MVKNHLAYPATARIVETRTNSVARLSIPPRAIYRPAIQSRQACLPCKALCGSQTGKKRPPLTGSKGGSMRAACRVASAHPSSAVTGSSVPQATMRKTWGDLGRLGS